MFLLECGDERRRFSEFDDFTDVAMPKLAASIARADTCPSVSTRSMDDKFWRIQLSFSGGVVVCVTSSDQLRMNTVHSWLQRLEIARLRAGLVGIKEEALHRLLEREGVAIELGDPGSVRQWLCAVEALVALGLFAAADIPRRHEQIVASLARELRDLSSPMQTVCSVFARWVILAESAPRGMNKEAVLALLEKDLFDEDGGPANEVPTRLDDYESLYL